VQQGRPEHIYREPTDEYVAGLFGPFMSIPLEEAISSGLAEKKGNGKILFARPENFQFVEPGKGAAAVVEDIRFAGRHYEIHARLANRAITALSGTKPMLAAGDTIFLKLEC
jgi:iron(III) transport system ATP-binding protein